MDFELLNTDHHKSNLALFRCWDDGHVCYKKISLSKKSNFLIENEKAGYSWFYSKIGEEDKTEIFSNYYQEITVPEFKGKTFSANATIRNNQEIVSRFIKYYRNIWLSEFDFSIHGDVALCNIVDRGNDDFMIIDWEHFHFADFDYFGYDIVNLLFIALHHEFGGINNITSDIVRFINKSLKDLFQDVKPDNKIKGSPFKNASRYLKKYKSRFNLNVPVENKFVLSRYTGTELTQLDRLVTDQ